MSGEAAPGDGLEFIEKATGKTVRATRADDGWTVESDDGQEKRLSIEEFGEEYEIRAGGDS